MSSIPVRFLIAGGAVPFCLALVSTPNANASTGSARPTAQHANAAFRSGSDGPIRLSAPAQTRYYDNGKHYRICFNTWGKRVKSGYKISLEKRVTLGHKTIWKATYYGPKHKTCSSWEKASTVFIDLNNKTAKKGGVYGDFWLYWY